jgi:hypothetical protein
MNKPICYSHGGRIYYRLVDYISYSETNRNNINLHFGTEIVTINTKIDSINDFNSHFSSPEKRDKSFSFLRYQSQK